MLRRLRRAARPVTSVVEEGRQARLETTGSPPECAVPSGPEKKFEKVPRTLVDKGDSGV
jgi:hypothetical protein